MAKIDSERLVDGLFQLIQHYKGMSESTVSEENADYYRTLGEGVRTSIEYIIDNTNYLK